MTPGRTLPTRSPAAQDCRQVAATTDVHSALDWADTIVSSLAGLRANGTLIADCGDFFEGTGYYVLGRGDAETALLCGLYDVAAPGNHGYRHHLTSPCLRAITVCANVTNRVGAPLWAPLVFARVSGRRTAITAVLGTDAFSSIPPADRHGHQVHDPATALRALYRRHHDEADAWIVLSHSGFGHDLKLAAACQFVDVIFAGHCHSDQYGPQAVGRTVIVKGGELATGYATARPTAGQWHTEVRDFTGGMPVPAGLPAELAGTLAALTRIRASLAVELGPVISRFACRMPSRDELLGGLCTAAMSVTGADAVLLNLTCLRETSLGTVLTTGELMSVEPFGNHLITITTPDADATATRLTAGAGPLITAPRPLPAGMVCVATTDYLAATYLRGGPEREIADGSAQPLRVLAAALLTGSTGEEGP